MRFGFINFLYMSKIKRMKIGLSCAFVSGTIAQCILLRSAFLCVDMPVLAPTTWKPTPSCSHNSKSQTLVENQSFNGLNVLK